MAAQVPVLTQRIWGAFNPTSNAIVGVQISGESVYQNVPNELITPTYAGVRTATHAATNTVLALGKTTQADGGGATFVYNPLDTSSGCVCTGTAAGTVLTVSAISSGTILVGQTLASSVTGVPLATILSFGSGLGGTGTYNLSASVTQVASTTFLLDNNSSVLVSADGSRWYSSAASSGLLAPSGNSAFAITNSLYTLGNTTDNPNITMVGTGNFTVPSEVVGAALPKGTGTINVSGGYYINGLPAVNLPAATTTTTPATITTVDTYVTPAYAIPANTLGTGSFFRITLAGLCTSSVANSVNMRIRIGTAGTTADNAVSSGFGTTAAAAGTNISFTAVFLVVFDTSSSCLPTQNLSNPTGTGISSTPGFVVTTTTHTGTIVPTVNQFMGVSIVTGAATTAVQIISAIIERLA